MQVRVVPRLASKRAGKVRIPLGSQFLNDSADALAAPHTMTATGDGFGDKELDEARAGPERAKTGEDARHARARAAPSGGSGTKRGLCSVTAHASAAPVKTP